MKVIKYLFVISMILGCTLAFVGEILGIFSKQNETIDIICDYIAYAVFVLMLLMTIFWIFVRKDLNREAREKNLEKYKNVYFIIGTAYAGKSTMVKLLSEKYNGILCEENYHDRLINTLDKDEYPNLCYTRDLKDWSEFIRRTPKEYEKWIKGVTKECEWLELHILDEIISNNEENKLIFVDTNISMKTLKKISDKDHVLVMVSDPEVSVNIFFNREDKEKQFLYQLLLKEEDVDKATSNFKLCLKRVNNKKIYNKYVNSGFNYIIRDDNRSVEETIELVEERFGLNKEN